MIGIPRRILLGLFTLLAPLALASDLPRAYAQEEVRYSTFLEDVKGHRVDYVLLQGDMIYGVRKDQTQFKAYNPETDYTALINNLIQAQVAIEGRPPRQGDALFNPLLWLTPAVLLFLALLYVARQRATPGVGPFAGWSAPRGTPGTPPGLLLPPGASVRASGSLATVASESGRPVPLEVQTLVVPTQLPAPRREAQGLDSGRLAMLLAVASRHAGLALQDQDVFVGIPGAGLPLRDPGIDLPLVLALAGSRREPGLPAHLMAFGEIDLTGEVRPVRHAEQRLRLARQLGFKIALVARGNEPRQALAGLQVLAVSRVQEAIDAAFAAKAT